MSAEHGGGGGNGMGFFIALFACVAVAWFFAQVQRQGAAPDSQTASVEDSVFDSEEMPRSAQTTPRAPAHPASDHGVTYVLDEDGNILDVVRF